MNNSYTNNSNNYRRYQGSSPQNAKNHRNPSPFSRQSYVTKYLSSKCPRKSLENVNFEHGPFVQGHAQPFGDVSQNVICNQPAVWPHNNNMVGFVAYTPSNANVMLNPIHSNPLPPIHSSQLYQNTTMGMTRDQPVPRMAYSLPSNALYSHPVIPPKSPVRMRLPALKCNIPPPTPYMDRYMGSQEQTEVIRHPRPAYNGKVQVPKSSMTYPPNPHENPRFKSSMIPRLMTVVEHRQQQLQYKPFDSLQERSRNNDMNVVPYRQTQNACRYARECGESAFMKPKTQFQQEITVIKKAGRMKTSQVVSDSNIYSPPFVRQCCNPLPKYQNRKVEQTINSKFLKQMKYSCIIGEEFQEESDFAAAGDFNMETATTTRKAQNTSFQKITSMNREIRKKESSNTVRGVTAVVVKPGNFALPEIVPLDEELQNHGLVRRKRVNSKKEPFPIPRNGSRAIVMKDDAEWIKDDQKIFPSTLPPLEEFQVSSAIEDAIEQLKSGCWNNNTVGLTLVVRMLRHHDDIIKKEENLEALISCILKILNTPKPKSFLMRATLKCLQELFYRVGSEMENLDAIEGIMLSIFDKSTDLKEFIRKEVSKTIHAALRSISPSIMFNSLHRGFFERNWIIRLTTASALVHFIKMFGPGVCLVKYGDRMLPLIVSLFDENRVELREVGRNAILELKDDPQFLKHLQRSIAPHAFGNVARKLSQFIGLNLHLNNPPTYTHTAQPPKQHKEVWKC